MILAAFETSTVFPLCHWDRSSVGDRKEAQQLSTWRQARPLPSTVAQTVALI
jgi:hypothetical protein